jgi:prevent-host-death family protein
METVGIRELKDHLSRYVRQVEAGDTVIVTDRGRVVAELVPPGHADRRRADIHPGLLEMERKGQIRLATRPNDPSLYRTPRPHLELGETAQQMLDAIRGDR